MKVVGLGLALALVVAAALRAAAGAPGTAPAAAGQAEGGREKAHLRFRNRLDLGSAARRYLRDHEDLDGGLSVEDDWPRGPYLLQRLTRDRARHTAALKRLVRFPRALGPVTSAPPCSPRS